MGFAIGARNGLRFQRHHLQIIGKPLAGEYGVKPLGEFRILRGNASGIFALVPLILGTGRGSQGVIFCFPMGVIVAKRHKGRRAD